MNKYTDLPQEGNAIVPGRIDPQQFTDAKLEHIASPVQVLPRQEEASQAIEAKYEQLGGESGPLGKPAFSPMTPQPPASPDNTTPGLLPEGLERMAQETAALKVKLVRLATDGVGFYRHFQFGSIYWTPQTGAHEVYGDIWRKWNALQLEHGFLGYPFTDEMTTAGGHGRFNRFQGGVIYWTNSTGAHEVHGAILQRWNDLGTEQSFLGYPTSDETDNPDGNGGRYNQFQNGFISWTTATGANEHNNGIPYTFSVDSMFVRTTRSGNVFGTAKDTDVVSLQMKAGDQVIASVNKNLGDFKGGGPYPVGCAVTAPVDDPTSRIIASFQIINSGDGITDDERKAEQAGFDKLSAAAIGAAVGLIGGLPGALLGSILGEVAAVTSSLLFANCDGLIAADASNVSGATLNDLTAAAPFKAAKTYPGVDSPAGCGDNSSYDVTWSMAQQR